MFCGQKINVQPVKNHIACPESEHPKSNENSDPEYRKKPNGLTEPSVPVSHTTENMQDKKARKMLKTAAILKTASTAFCLISLLIILFSPLFSYDYITTVDGIKTTQETDISLFTFSVNGIRTVVDAFGYLGTESSDFLAVWLGFVFSFVEIYVFISFITINIKTVSRFVSHAKKLFDFDNYYRAEINKTSAEITLQNAAKNLKSRSDKSIWYNMILNVGLVLIFNGYRRIIISTAAVAAIMLAASIILDITANCIKKSGLNQQ